jgi:2-C-methyl-D-erythritol 4-phosphate cytidylyltransferase
VHKCVAGGSERFHSVKAGIEALSQEVTSIAVHDGVRALVSKKLIIRAALAVEENEAVIPVIDVVDSYRKVTNQGSEIVPRGELRIVQTPQVFKSETLRRAYEQDFSTSFTDDASVVEATGVGITLIDGERSNLKLTTPEDIEWAEMWLHREKEE